MKRISYALALSLLPALVWAGDKEAMDHDKKAVEHWSDPDPKVAIEHFEKALSEAEGKVLKTNLLLYLGQLHQAKTGDFDKALDCYDKIIRANVGVKDDRLKNLKADALLNKGTILYSERDDVEAALAAYQAAHSTYPKARNADVLAQLCFRIGRDPAKSAAARSKQLEYSEKLSREALHHDKENRNKSSKPADTARYRLQLAIVLYAQDKRDEATQVWEETDQSALTLQANYQLAIFQAIQGEGAEVVAKTLRETLMDEKARSTPRARNQLRKFIRTEPDFKAFLAEPSWKDLVTDEAA